MGSYYLYGLKLDGRAAILSFIYGLLTTTFICINNLRDRETDSEVGKKTLATRMSIASYKAFTLGTIFSPYFLLIQFHDMKLLPIMGLSLIPGVILAKIAMKSTGAELNQGLKFCGIHLVIFSILLCGVFSYGHKL